MNTYFTQDLSTNSVIAFVSLMTQTNISVYSIHAFFL